MQPSQLENKSKMLTSAAKLLHDNDYYCAVAHCAYYSCYQLLKHLWLYKMGKTQEQLDSKCSLSHSGSHEVLINEIGQILNIDHLRIFNNKMTQLKRLRTDADYGNRVFDSVNSEKSLALSEEIIFVLNKYK
jgi:uncharacterized protein (UPF0332 family)